MTGVARGIFMPQRERRVEWRPSINGGISVAGAVPGEMASKAWSEIAGKHRRQCYRDMITIAALAYHLLKYGEENNQACDRQRRWRWQRAAALCAGLINGEKAARRKAAAKRRRRVMMRDVAAVAKTVI